MLLSNSKFLCWVSTVAYPADGKMYEWDESTLAWTILTAS